MKLKDERQVQNTREKLRILEARVEAVRRDPAGNTHVQELTLRSLRRLINDQEQQATPERLQHRMGGHHHRCIGPSMFDSENAKKMAEHDAITERSFES